MRKIFPFSQLQLPQLVLLVLPVWLFAFEARAFVHDGNSIRQSEECVIGLVLNEMGFKRPVAELPKITLTSETTLESFQDAVESQWSFRPDVMTNVYVLRLNEVFLMADSADYRDGRNIFDALAHELVHFVQVKTWNMGPEDFSDAEEAQAIAIQTAFREKYGTRIERSVFHCPEREPSAAQGSGAR